MKFLILIKYAHKIAATWSNIFPSPSNNYRRKFVEYNTCVGYYNIPSPPHITFKFCTAAKGNNSFRLGKKYDLPPFSAKTVKWHLAKFTAFK